MSKFLNTSNGRYETTAYGVKEHSVTMGYLIATVVIVPIGETVNKKGESVTIFAKTGVRIEDVRLRQTYKNWKGETFTLPGHVYFYFYKNETISEHSPWGFASDRMGIKANSFGVPETVKPTSNYAGVEPCKHRLHATLMSAVSAAEQSHEA